MLVWIIVAIVLLAAAAVVWWTSGRARPLVKRGEAAEDESSIRAQTLHDPGGPHSGGPIH